MDTIPNAAGFDSIMTIQVTIDTLNVTLTDSGNVLHANQFNGQYQWSSCPSFTSIVGETNQSFTATSSGSYAVIVSNNSCIDTSSCHNVLIVGVDDLINGADFVVYPNPSNGLVSVDLLTENNHVIITLDDIQGRNIFTKAFSEVKVLTFRLDQEPGTYILRIESEKGKKSTRLILK